jgi:hypothetical protein
MFLLQYLSLDSIHAICNYIPASSLYIFHCLCSDCDQGDAGAVAGGEPGGPRGLGEGRGAGRIQPQAAQEQVIIGHCKTKCK